MNNDHRGVRRLSDPQDTAHRLGLQIVRPGLGMACDGVFAHGFFLRHQRINDAAVLTMDAADAAADLQSFQSAVQVAVRQHHGGIGHVHFEGGNAGGEHIVQFALDAGVPVVDGHMEAVITVAVRRFFPPQFQTVLQRFSLVGAGEVDDGGGAAPQRRTAAAFKIVGSGGIAHVQVKVGMGVDEAGQQQLAGHIYLLRVRGIDLGRNGYDLLAVHQHICHRNSAAADHAAAGKESFHQKVPPCSVKYCLYYSILPQKRKGQAAVTETKNFCFLKFF